MIRADLTGKVVALLGMGIDMEAALPAIVEVEPSLIYVVDADRSRARQILADADLVTVPILDTVADLPAADVAIRSPGFPLYSPELQDRVKAGLVTVTPLGLWLAERGHRPTASVTGTKGKSSASVLTTLALEHLGRPALTLGNIGVPPWTHSPDVAQTVVIEISSYQAADLGVAPSIASLTSIGEDHVDWHGSFDQYLRDKARVFTAPVLGDRRWAGVLADVMLPEPFASIDFHRVPAPEGGGVRARNAHLAAATALALALNADDVDVAQIEHVAAYLLSEYPELPGRFRPVETVNSVVYIDDALASNPLGLAISIGEVGSEPLTLIVGGASRGASFDPVFLSIQARTGPTNVICIDDAVPLEPDLARAGATTYRAPDLENAVGMAGEITPAGGTVLFSPGMPTPSAEGNWENRSTRFHLEVEYLRQRS